jgi:hypothetical protein
MPRLADSPYSDIKALPRKLERVLEREMNLDRAAQRGVELLYAEFEESIVLARLYVTVPFKELPPTERAFVDSMVAPSPDAASLNDGTRVLTLMGSRGANRAWNDRHTSKGHLAIPLLKARYVDEIPMIARLMIQMGIGLEWIDRGDTAIVYRILGKVAGLFFVEEASSAVDQLGRKIIPAQDFVREHGVRTVFGIGGGYLNGTFAALIVFCRELVTREQVERLMPCINAIKSATMEAVMQRRLFTPQV